MRRIFGLIVLVSMVVFMVACASAGEGVQSGVQAESMVDDDISAQSEITLNNTVGDGSFTVIEEFDHTVFRFDYPGVETLLENGATLRVYFLISGKGTEGYQQEIDGRDYQSFGPSIYLSPSGDLPISYEEESGRQHHDTEYIIEEDSVSVYIYDLRFDISSYPYTGVHLLSDGDSPFWEAFAPEDVLVSYDGERDFFKFEDPVMEEYISLLKRIPIGQITLGDLEDMESIGISDYDIPYLEGTGVIGEDGKGNITSLEDLKHMPNLTKVNFRNHQISDISVLAQLPNLEDIYLSGNNISDISALAGAEKLEDVMLNDNNIQDTSALSNLTNLRHVHLDNNNITTIPDLSRSDSLYTISLRHNQITDVTPLVTYAIIDWVILDYNNITDLSPMAQMTTLRELSLEGNPISDITPLGSIPTLGILNVKQTNVTDFSAVEHSIAILERD